MDLERLYYALRLEIYGRRVGDAYKAFYRDFLNNSYDTGPGKWIGSYSL